MTFQEFLVLTPFLAAVGCRADDALPDLEGWPAIEKHITSADTFATALRVRKVDENNKSLGISGSVVALYVDRTTGDYIIDSPTPRRRLMSVQGETHNNFDDRLPGPLLVSPLVALAADGFSKCSKTPLSKDNNQELQAIDNWKGKSHTRVSCEIRGYPAEFTLAWHDKPLLWVSDAMFTSGDQRYVIEFSELDFERGLPSDRSPQPAFFEGVPAYPAVDWMSRH